MLEDALIGAMSEVGQLRHEREAIAGQALAGFALGGLMHQPVDTAAIRREGEEGRAMQQAFQIQVGALADQFQVEAIGLANGLAAAEFEHLEVVLDAFEKVKWAWLAGANIHVPPVQSMYQRMGACGAV